MTQRIIKFRAQKTDNKGNFKEWIYGTPEFGDMGQLYILYGTGGRQLCQRETLGQFTGLLDKNKKEIYEGDIVKHDPLFQEFKGKLHQGRVVIEASRGICIENVPLGLYPEVIGNVYENPELIKDADKV